MKTVVLKSVRIAVFFILELTWFASFYALHFNRQVLILNVLSSFANLPTPHQFNSLLMILTITLPAVIFLYFLNKSYLKFGKKLFLLLHGLFVLLILGVLESLVYFI